MVQVEVGSEGVYKSFRLCSVSVEYWGELAHGFYLSGWPYHSDWEWYSEGRSSSSSAASSTSSTSAASSTSASITGGSWGVWSARGW